MNMIIPMLGMSIVKKTLVVQENLWEPPVLDKGEPPLKKAEYNVSIQLLIGSASWGKESLMSWEKMTMSDLMRE